MTQITIKNFQQLPKVIFDVLFINDKNQQNISLIKITKLFPNAEEIVLNDLILSQFVAESSKYIDSVVHLANALKDANHLKLQSILFQSVKQNDTKRVATLKKLANKYSNKFTALNWKIKYRLQETHNLLFTDCQVIHVNNIKDCNVKQMVYLVKQVCNKSEQLQDDKERFISWFEQNNIDGRQFVSLQQPDSFEFIADDSTNNKLLKQPSALLLRELNAYDFQTKFKEEQEKEELELMRQELADAQAEAIERAQKLEQEQSKLFQLRNQLVEQDVEEQKSKTKENENENDKIKQTLEMISEYKKKETIFEDTINELIQ
eukprot:156131_1